MRPGLLPPRPASILLVRLSARGDMVFASPLVRAFRRTFPEARIAWLAESHTFELIAHHPELDEVIVWDRPRWKKLLRERRWGTLLREVQQFVGALRARRFDVAVDLQGLLRSGLLTFLSGAPVRIGLGSKEGSRVLMTHVLSRDGGDIRQISSEYRHLAEHLGLRVEPFRMEVPLTPAEREWASATLHGRGVEGGFAAAIPFTTRPQKHWFEDRWADLTDRILDGLGLRTVVLGGPGDQPALERIRAMARSEPVSLVGQTTLLQAAAVLERASLVVGVDTGLTHVAVALDRPTVTIFGSNIPYTKPPTPRTRVLVHWLECSPCKGNPTCDGEFTCLRRISVEEVLAAARGVLAHSTGQEGGGLSPAGSGGSPRGADRRKTPGDPSPRGGAGSEGDTPQ